MLHRAEKLCSLPSLWFSQWIKGLEEKRQNLVRFDGVVCFEISNSKYIIKLWTDTVKTSIIMHWIGCVQTLLRKEISDKLSSLPISRISIFKQKISHLEVIESDLSCYLTTRESTRWKIHMDPQYCCTLSFDLLLDDTNVDTFIAQRIKNYYEYSVSKATVKNKLLYNTFNKLIFIRWKKKFVV